MLDGVKALAVSVPVFVSASVANSTIPLFVVLASSPAIVMVPVPLVISIPSPSLSVALVSVFPVVLPIRSWPLVYVVCPVPPWSTATVVPSHVPDAMVPTVVILDVPGHCPMFEGVTARTVSVPVFVSASVASSTIPLLVVLASSPAMVIVPVPLVTSIPSPSVRVATDSVLPVVLPISN